MKRNKGDGNIIEKKETDQDKVMSENEETECQIGQNHDGNWRFEQYFTKNRKTLDTKPFQPPMSPRMISWRIRSG